jgi:predicted nucleic acid-binding protein
LAPLLMLGARIAWKAAEIYRELRHHGGAKMIDGVIATACNCFSA